MPKKAVGGRGRRRRDAATATNLHQESRRPVKLGYTVEGRRRLIRKIVGISLVAVGLLIVLTHMVVHLGGIQWLPTTGLQDLLTGYPMGGVFIVAGMIALTKQDGY